MADISCNDKDNGGLAERCNEIYYSVSADNFKMYKTKPNSKINMFKQVRF